MTAQSRQAANIGSQLNNIFKDAAIDKCCERKCKLGLRGISNYSILKGEKIASGQKMCDCVIIHDVSPPRIILVELKSGGIRFEQIVEKFENGLQLLAQTDRTVQEKQTYNVKMLLLVKRRQPKTFYTRIRAHKLEMKGRKHSIITLRCGAELVNVYRELA